MSDLPVPVSSDLDNWSDESVLLYSYLQSLSDDLENWAEDQDLQAGLELVRSEDLDNWDDENVNLQHSRLIVGDTLTFSDAAGLGYRYFITVNSTNSLSDDISILTLGLQVINPSDDLDEWDDETVLFSDYLLKIGQFLNHFRDSINVVHHLKETLSEDLDNWNDTLDATLMLGLTVVTASTLDNWDDNASREFISRLGRNKHSLLNSYIRRYLNDPKTPITKDIRINATDSAGNWNDEVN